MKTSETSNLKERLLRCELTIGSWTSFGFAPIGEMMARAGFDWLVIDMEHTGIGTAQQFQLIQVIELSGCIPLVRVGANDPLLIKRALDAGAHGIVVPMVNTPEDAEEAVSAAHYPPKGSRGAGLSRAQDYGLDFSGYKSRADRNTVVIAQIEHIRAVENLEAIMDVDGIDAFIVGPYDLSGSLGRPGCWDDAAVESALAEVERIMRSGEKPGGFHVVHSNHEELRRRIDSGYRFLAYGDDMVFLAEKLKAEESHLKTLLPVQDQ